MAKHLPVILFFLYASLTANAQHASLKGTVSDTLNGLSLSNTSITLLFAKDSVLYRFTRSDPDGNFEMNRLAAGSYLMLVTYPGYADYVDSLAVKDSSTYRLGKIILTLKSKLLADVIVHARISSIRLKGDTTEYTADSFKVQPNATVEDLLKELPGIQVDKNGQITAQGQKVQKVLVDGEEFFGDDPTLVTRNLTADMVDKVQVYNKKSDQAAFTGIDDGKTQKTINLKLKANKKNGYFGKADLGGGTGGYQNNELMYNRFENKKKFAAYGIVSNTGTSGLNWQDLRNYGDDPLSNADVSDDGGISITINNSDGLDSWNGQYNGQGYPLIQTGGLHFNNKWDDDKQSVNTNYKILQLHVTGSSQTSSQYLLPDTLYYNNQSEHFVNNILRNRINGNYEYQLDSSSSLRISADGGDDHKVTSSSSYTESRASDLSLVNNENRQISNTGDDRSVNSNLIWRKKFKKKGRTISVNFRENYSNNQSSGYLYAVDSFFSKGNFFEKQITDQYKTNSSSNTSLNTKITYSEPLTEVSSLVFNYGIAIDNSSAALNSFNKGTDGKYSVLDSLFSNKYAFNVLTSSGGLSYSLFRRKLKFNAGTDIGFTGFSQRDLLLNTTSKRNFVNWYPRINFSYQFSPQKELSLGYTGNTRQPSLQQIQPIHTNNDPLNISVGNPNLKPAFENSLNLNYSSYKMLSQSSLWTSFTYNFTQNAISSKDFVDSLGRRIYQSINLNGNRSFESYLSYWFKLKKLNLQMGLNGNFNTSRYVSIVNNSFNATTSGIYTAGLHLSREKEKKYSIDLGTSATYTHSTSSIQSGVQTNFWTYDLNPGLHIFLPLRLEINTDCDFNLRQKTPVFDANNNVILWNAWIGRKFLKKDALLVKLSGNDLLDQNVGFNRTVNSNYISQNTYSTIRRYFLLSVVWNFSKTGIHSGDNSDQ